MKTFTKHILLLALMLFGVAGAAWADRAPQKFTGPVDIATLVEYDTLAPGFELTGISAFDNLQFEGGRFSINGTPQADPVGTVIGNANSLSYTDGNIILIFGQTTFTMAPMVDMTTAGNAWVVTDAIHTTDGSEIHISGITLYIAPDPTVPALDELTGNWNFLMPGSNKVVKAVLYDSIVVGPHVELYDAAPAFAAGDIYTRGDSTIYYYDTNNHHSFYLRADEQADGKFFGYWSDLDPTDPQYTDRTYRRVSPGNLTCGHRFTAAYPNNYSLTLAREGYGTLKLDGVGVDTVYTITFEQSGISGDSRSFTIPASRFPYDTTFSYNANVSFAYAYDQMGGSVDIFAQGANWITVRISGPFKYGGYYSCELEGGASDDWTISCTATGTQPKMPYGITKTGNGTYSVMEGLTVSVTATPDSAHYLSAIDGHDTVSNHACGYSFVMPSSSKDLLATFNDKPTLTLTQTEGGTLEAIVPQGGGEETLLTTITATGISAYSQTTPDIVTVSLNDITSYNYIWGWLNSGSVTVEAPQGYTITRCVFKQNPSGTPNRVLEDDLAPFTATMVGNLDGGTDVSATTTHGDEIGDDFMSGISSIEVYGYQNVAANVIASSTPNTYYIDYGTPVTVVATPDAEHYLVSFSDDAPATERNSNIAVEKRYDSVVNNINLTANFQAKPTLTLTANEGGTLTLDGMGGTTLTLISYSNIDLPDYQTVSREEARALCGTDITSGTAYVFYKNEGTAYIGIQFQNGVEQELDIAVSNISYYVPDPYDEGLKLYYTTRHSLDGVTATETENQYRVDYGTEVTVVATPDSVHYLATLGGVTMGSNTAKDTTFAVTATTNLAANFAQKPTLTLAHNDGGEMEIVPEEVMAVSEYTLPSSWNGDNSLAAATDLPSDFQSVSEAEARTWQNTTGEPVILFFKSLASGSAASYVRFNADGTIAEVGVNSKRNIYNEASNGSLVRYTTAGAASNFIASTAESNTYYIDYNTSVTVKATPSDTAYLVRFDEDEALNRNTDTTKTYGPLTAALTTATATFNAKPVLTLAVSDTSWGKVSIELVMGTASTASEVQIGEGTGTTYYFPIDNYFNYSCTEQIYTADEIGTAGTINSISFYYNYGTPYTASNVTMYMKNVSRSVFAANTDCEPLSVNDIVWTGSIAPTEAGWYTFTLDTPFEYNGTDNLMVAFFDGTTGYPGTSYTWRQTPSPNGANMALRYYSDSQSPDPYNLSGYTGSKALYTYRGNIKLDITPATLSLPAGVAQIDSVTYRVDYGTTVTVQADATELHHVKNWVDADSVAYPANSITYSDYFVTTPEPLFPAFSTLTLTVTADTVTKTIFGINSYDVFARVDTTEDVRGTVRAEYIDIDGVSQSVAADDTVTYTAQGGSLSLVIATPTEPGYHFERWTDTLGAELGTNDTLEVTEAAAVIAVFDTNVYQISGTVAEGSEEWGEVTGSGDYRHFTQATLEALPIEHYHFVKWEDGNTENPRVIDVVGPESHQAEFAIDRFIVSWSSNDEAMGHVVGPYDNHTTGAPIPRLRGSWGTTFQLVAQPAEHHMLDYWSSGQTTDIIQHTITENAELVAYFKHVPYIVTVLSEDETMGTVAGTDTLEWQESTEISATANYGYHFTMWNDSVTDNPRTVVNNIESDQTFTASFAKNEYTVTVVSADETMGSVSGTDTVEYLDEIEISATANEHYHFVQWNDGETANPRTVSVTKNETYTATFAPNVYTLTLGSNNAIMGTVALTAPAVTPNADGSYSIAYGTAVTVQGSASSRCFELGSWSDGAVVTADGSHSFSMAGNLVLTATFVNHLFRSDTVADVCDRFVWHGIAYTETPDVAPLHRLTTVDGCDSALVLNLTVRHSSTGVDEQVHCTPYTWIDGVTYSESNHTAQYILPGANAEQCDSIVTLDLTIGTQAESTEVVNACDSYEWHGVVYTETPAEAPTYTYHTLEGCDSTVTLQLTIGHPTEGIETIVACAPIEWHGTVYSESTDEPTWHTTNAAGCDSTVTLHLTIAPAIETEETVEACDEYEWHGVVYTETPAEAPTYTTVSVQGCDSTVTLHLTVNHSTAAVETVVACNSYEWHGVSYASSTTVPTYTTTGSNGCDSTTTLHLTINRSTSAVETVEACDSYEWHGTTYTVSTSLPTYTTEGSNGCDSTTTLNLTIKQSSRATETVVTCDEYEWHGVLFTETPVEAPTYTTEGSNGCDSTVTLNLTVNHSADVVETIGACAAIEWHGTVYSESTTEPTWHSTTVAGCDSTVTLHLTISDRIETEETVVACDSYEWHGVVYTASTDNATWSTTSIQGCDSTVTLHLTINRSTTGSETIEACESYEWHGVTYRQSGSYTFDTLNVAGCDSTVTLTLTLHQPTSGSEFVTTCGSYVWHEVTYTQSGAYVWHGTDVHGCDSTVTLLLTILQPVYSTENRTACNSYTWHGTEYSESGDYTWSTTAVSGCDSIVTLHLTINLPVTSDVEESACERYSWNGIVYSTSGDYVQTFTGVNGCDSTVTLHLTVNMPATETLGVTACDSYEWHEVTYTESGVYSWHGTTVAGCDSTATLNLTIGHSADTTISLQGEGSIVWNGETFTQSGTYERVIRTVLGCDSTVTLNLVILPEGFVMPYLYNIMDVVLTINHFQQGETNLQYHWYRWYRNGKMVAEGRAMDTYSEGGSKLNGVYYLEVAIDESLEYWVRSNEVTIGTVGIDEAEDIDFTVAPNPVMHGSTVSVAVEGADVQGAVISVYDVQGREVLRQQNSAFIEAPAASGMYMVRLTLNDGRTAVKRLIVK